MINSSEKKENVNKSAVLIDGSGFIYRAFFALPKFTKSNGEPVGAVFGFCSMLISLIFEHSSDVFIVVLDSGRNTFRSEFYNEYKKNREETPSELKAQFQTLQDACSAFGVPVVLKQGFEADDIIASYADKLSKNGYKVEIVSSDKDLMQLISDKVSMYDPLKSKLIDRDQVFEKYGVWPEEMIEFQALMGDTSDNIPGVPGIGPKTAAKLISEFKTLENLYNSLDKISHTKLQEKLKDNKNLVDISLKLVTLVKNIEINEKFETLNIKLNLENIINFLKEQEFHSLIPRVTNKFEKQKSKRNFIQLSSLDDLRSFCNRKISNKFSFFCSSLSSESHVLAISTDSDTAFIKFNFSDDLFSRGISIFDIQQILNPYLEDKSIQKISFRNNIEYFSNDYESYDDISVMHYIVYGVSNDKIGDIFPYANESLKKLYINKISDVNYICEISSLLFDSFEILKNELKNSDLLKIYETIDYPMIKILEKMKSEGILVSSQKLNDLKIKFLNRIKEIEHRIFKNVGHEFNIGSVKQLAEVLFEELKLKKPNGKISTNVDVLEDLSFYTESKIPDLVLEWRKLSKLTSTYTDSLLNSISKKTNRIHTTFSLTSTVTGRLSSFNPNLQNIPVKTNEGKEIKSAFIAPQGKSLIASDYSQIELRILADVANIPLLKNAFINGEDIHTTTASEIFEKPANEIDNNMRRHAKVINFGILYGMSPFGLAKALNISREEASLYLKNHLKKFQGFEEFKNKTLEFARHNGFVKTIFDRKLYIKDISSKNFRLRNFAERQAVNAVIQGSAADIVKRAMINVGEVLDSIHSKMLLQIHDELVFETPDNYINKAQNIIKEKMELKNILSVPLIVNIKIGKNL